jgi:hypothetical protein
MMNGQLCLRMNRLVKSWVPFADVLKAASELVYYAGTDEGGMVS